jgi:F-type H+-transporting ATPase subunit delta
LFEPRSFTRGGAVTSHGAAIRYARALFDVTRAEGKDLVQTERDLSGFAQILTGNESLYRALTNPAIPVAKKKAVVEQLIGRAGSLQPAVAKLLLVLAERDRLAIVPDVAQAFANRLMDHQNVVRAEIVTAEPLPADRVSALTQELERATGRNVQVATRVDESIIGGAVAKIGSTVYDGSITRQLERMRETLISADG